MKEITISNDRRHMGVLRHFPWGISITKISKRPLLEDYIESVMFPDSNYNKIERLSI